jgi:hypothetical protein
MAAHVRFIEDHFPLVLCLGADVWDDQAVSDLAAGSERLFARGERYTLIVCSPIKSEMGARARKLITDWSNKPHVREKSRALCVGSATVVRNPLHRGALTAILWLWKPPAPHEPVATPEAAVDWCLERMQAEGVSLPRSREVLRRLAIEQLGKA